MLPICPVMQIWADFSRQSVLAKIKEDMLMDFHVFWAELVSLGSPNSPNSLNKRFYFHTLWYSLQTQFLATNVMVFYLISRSKSASEVKMLRDDEHFQNYSNWRGAPHRNNLVIMLKVKVLITFLKSLGLYSAVGGKFVWSFKDQRWRIIWSLGPGAVKTFSSFSRAILRAFCSIAIFMISRSCTSPVIWVLKYGAVNCKQGRRSQKLPVWTNSTWAILIRWSYVGRGTFLDFQIWGSHNDWPIWWSTINKSDFCRFLSIFNVL